MIIAEAGVNHNGNLELALQLAQQAKDCGADIVKFQTFKTENLVSIDAPKAEYQITNTDNTESQYQMLKKLELTLDDYMEIRNYCDEIGIKFFSTAFDLESITFLKSLNLGLWKIPSGEITNLPYLQIIGSYNEPTILSTGMSLLSEVEDAVKSLYAAGLQKENLTILHCTSNYPTSMNEVNLQAMVSLRDHFDVNVGYSDHTLGADVAIGAVALGATVIEKHFTLDKNMEGPDHKASLDVKELKEYIERIRNIELALGDGVKRPMPSELKTLKVARKSIHINKDLLANHTIKYEDLEMKRPGDGMSPMDLASLIGKRLRKNIYLGKKISREDLL